MSPLASGKCWALKVPVFRRHPSVRGCPVFNMFDLSPEALQRLAQAADSQVYLGSLQCFPFVHHHHYISNTIEYCSNLSFRHPVRKLDNHLNVCVSNASTIHAMSPRPQDRGHARSPQRADGLPRPFVVNKPNKTALKYNTACIYATTWRGTR